MENKNLNKIAFDSEEAVKIELERILETRFNVCKSTKPCRYYKDDELNKWFLTSKITIVEYNK